MVDGNRADHEPDWLCGADYEYTVDFPRLGWSWGFLRRDPGYREAWSVASRAFVAEAISWRLRGH